ncbi:MAG: hypothetical protein GF331_11865 [Chitinivibrionales bacterium]|nr:hypothetical protein [Chitinivibrionales bacterium]
MRLFWFTALLMLVPIASPALAATVLDSTLPNGDRVQFDGTYYDFRAANGKQMVKVWVPPAVKPVRGLLITGHGGGTGDSRHFPRDTNMRAFAVRHGFGLAGLHWFPGRMVYDSGHTVFFGALNAFAELGTHPELAHVPFVVFGGSNGGATSYGLSCSAPDRAICFTPNAAAWWNPEVPTAEMMQVPAIFVLGLFDPFMRGTGVETTIKLVADARTHGARWCVIAEEKGHEDGASWQLFTRFWDRCIELRLPADADPSKGPVTLRDIPEDEGWLVDPATWGSGLTVVAPYDEYKGDRAAAGWVPDADIAYLYRSVATYDNPIILSSPDLSKAFNPDTDYRSRLVGVADPAVAPGSTVRVVCDMSAFPGWKKVELYDGATKIGQIKSGRKPELTIEVDKEQRVYNISALGYGPDGIVRASTPLYFYVKDPTATILSEAERSHPVFDASERTFTGSSTATATALPTPNDTDAVLIAYGLTAEQEKQFDPNDGKLSPFWASLDNSYDCIRMSQRRNGGDNAAFAVVINNDARLLVKAARSAAGLYLLFEATDNRFVDVASLDNYYHYDAVDVLIDSRSAEAICAGDIDKTFVNRFWGLSLTTRQYQVAFGDTVPPAVFKRNQPDPWDMAYELVSITDAAKRYGMRIDFATPDKFRRAQEWFIPWSELGNGGIEAEPAMGARIGFAPGYNDTDPGEYLPGHSGTLRWLGGKSPWGYAAQEGKAPMGWGDIEMGPMIAGGAAVAGK